MALKNHLVRRPSPATTKAEQGPPPEISPQLLEIAKAAVRAEMAPQIRLELQNWLADDMLRRFELAQAATEATANTKH